MKCQLLLSALALSGMSEGVRMIEKVKDFGTMTRTLHRRANKAEATVDALERSATQFKQAKELVVQRFGPRVAVQTEDSVFYGNMFLPPLQNANIQAQSAFMGPHDTLWVVGMDNVVYKGDTKASPLNLVNVAENYRFALPWQNGFFGLSSDGHGHSTGNIFFVPDATKPDQRVEIQGALLRLGFDGEMICGEGLQNKCHCVKFDTTTLQQGPDDWTHHDVRGVTCYPAGKSRLAALKDDGQLFLQPTAGGDMVFPQPSARYAQASLNGDFLVGFGTFGNLWFGESDNGDGLYTAEMTKSAWTDGIGAAKSVEVYWVPMPDF